MKKIVSIIVSSALILTGAMQANMFEELEQVQEKYKDAFKRQEALSKNPDFLNKFNKIRESHENDLKAFQAKYKTSSTDMYDEVNNIKEKYKHAFEKKQDMHNNPEYEKEVEKAHDATSIEIDKIQKKYNPLYDEIQKAKKETEEVLHGPWVKHSNGNKTPTTDMHNKIAKIHEKYKNAFEKEEEMLKNSEYRKEARAARESTAVEIDKIDKKYNPHYDELQKANQEIEKIQNNFWAQKNAMLSNKAYQTDLQAIGDKTASETINLMGEYDPELQKATQETIDIVKKHQSLLRPY